ncbi:MAG: hypothetical protein LBP85_01215, partial [Prevotellaceae bacterium]|nr:hypothetical protein [Prevotellaceae bacterium]
FSNSQIKLSVPLGCNQLNPTEFSKLKRRKRKRIEILFSQIDGQFSEFFYCFIRNFSYAFHFAF